MPLSMPSFFAGVGTVAGALVLGFGGGILLTNTAVKDTPQPPTRVERVARSEPLTVTKVEAPKVEAIAASAPPAPAPITPVVASPVQAAAAPPAPAQQVTPEPAKTVADVPKEPNTVKEPEKSGPAELAKRDGQAEQSKAEREQRRAERRAERQKRYDDQKARGVAFIRMKQRQLDEQKPDGAELAFDREEPRINLFGGIFGRSSDAPPSNRDE